MKIVVPIPVNGRLPLLYHTVTRLYSVNKVHKVILISDSMEVKQMAEALNCEYVYHPNFPLGAKWNAGFKACEKYKPDAVLFCGSSDWISKDYLSYYDKGYDVAGKLGCYFADIGHQQTRSVFWEGYNEPKRKGETIGIGRILSSRILSKMNWTPFEDTRDSSLDYSMWNKCIKLNGKFQTIPTDKGKLLSISHHAWINKHKFDEHWTNKIPSVKIQTTELLDEFSELELI